MVPNMLRATASIALAVAAISGCSGANAGSDPPSAPASTNTATPSTVTLSPTTNATAQGVALTIPGTIKGEVSRSVMHLTGVDTPTKSNIVGEPVKGRNYVVRSACAASTPALSTITYYLMDARADRPTNPTSQRPTAMTSQTPCDGQQHIDQVGPLAFAVRVDYGAMEGGVDTVYTIVSPQ